MKKDKKMLNKRCRLCLLVIQKPLDLKTMDEVRLLVLEIFGIEIEIGKNSEKDEYGICLSCSEKLQQSSELHQTIRETQKLLAEQKAKVEFSAEGVDGNEVEIKVEEEEEVYPEAVVLAPPENPKRTRTTKNTAPKTPKVSKNVEKPVSPTKVTNDDKNEEQEKQIAEFYHLACTKCSETFSRFATYKKHMTIKHKDPRPVVICCNLRLNKRCRLVEHMIFHTDPSQYECPECQKQFRGPDKLERHRKQWHQPREQRKFQCDKCPKRFISMNSLKSHLDSHLTKEEKAAMKTHICNECGSGYKYKSLLAQHMRKIHLKMYACICDICARTFNSKNDFLYHYASTHQEKQMPKVQCSICLSFLLNEKCLRSHISRIHKNIGPHICSICEKVKPSRQALRSHYLYVHEKERKYKCPHCEKAFKREVGLKEHITTHVGGGALYTCQFCDKTFNSGANMYSHRKRAHPIEHERLMQDIMNKKRPDNLVC